VKKVKINNKKTIKICLYAIFICLIICPILEIIPSQIAPFILTGVFIITQGILSSLLMSCVYFVGSYMSEDHINAIVTGHSISSCVLTILRFISFFIFDLQYSENITSNNLHNSIFVFYSSSSLITLFTIYLFHYILKRDKKFESALSKAISKSDSFKVLSVSKIIILFI
jgi:hypothetical protein